MAFAAREPREHGGHPVGVRSQFGECLRASELENQCHLEARFAFANLSLGYNEPSRLVGRVCAVRPFRDTAYGRRSGSPDLVAQIGVATGESGSEVLDTGEEPQCHVVGVESLVREGTDVGHEFLP